MVSLVVVGPENLPGRIHGRQAAEDDHQEQDEADPQAGVAQQLGEHEALVAAAHRAGDRVEVVLQVRPEALVRTRPCLRLGSIFVEKVEAHPGPFSLTFEDIHELDRTVLA